MTTKRTNKGTFKKGQSGNPSGRPKSSNLTAADRKNFKDSPMEALMYLMNTARTKEEVYKYAKELMPYVKPKLSSVKSEIEQETTVTVKIEGFEPIPLEAQTVDCIDLTAEEVEEVVKDRVEQLESK
jgi:hypothetical protein